MSDFEKRADSILEAVERKHEIQYNRLRHTRLFSLMNYAQGDPITVTLTAEPDYPDMRRHIAGRLFNPLEGLVQISDTDMPELEGQYLIGLSTTYATIEGDPVPVPGMVAGNSTFTYYKPRYISAAENREKDIGLRDPVRMDGLQYGRIAVNGAALFDFVANTWTSTSKNHHNK